jgi:hypothetical protein
MSGSYSCATLSGMAKTTTINTPEAARLLKVTFHASRFAEVKRVDAASGSFKIVVKAGTGKPLEALCKRMAWQVPDEHTVLQNLEGKFLGGSLVMRCNDKLVDAEAELPYKSITGFAIHRLELEGRKGKGFRRELRFNGTFDYQEGCAVIESYMNRIGSATGELTITYLKEEVQPDLPLTEAQQAVLEND